MLLKLAALSLAATALHAIVGGTAPDLIVGHGVLGLGGAIPP